MTLRSGSPFAPSDRYTILYADFTGSMRYF